MMLRYERMEQYLFDHVGEKFTAISYATYHGFKIREASADIQAYQKAQRRYGSDTLFVLRRLPNTRTRSSIWVGGVSTTDARELGVTFSRDVANRALEAFKPDLRRIGLRNPRAKAQTERQIKATIENALAIIDIATQGGFSDDDDEPE